MSRLTEKERLTGSDLFKMEMDCELDEVAEWHNKLHDLEDIEQELGIDLIALFKAVKNGIYYTKDALVSELDCLSKDAIYRAENQDVHYELGGSQKKSAVGISVYIRERNCYHYLKTADYGKTWASTREELEKGE